VLTPQKYARIERRATAAITQNTLHCCCGLPFGSRTSELLSFSLKSDFSCVETSFFRKSPLRCGSPNASTQVVHRPRSQSLLHFVTGTYSKFARKNNFLALGVCFRKPCSSAGRRFAASRSRLQNYRRIVSFLQQRIR